MKINHLLAAGAALGLMTAGAPGASAQDSHDHHAAAGSHAGHAVAPGGGLPMPAKVDNFRLKDETGKQHELYALKDAKAVVLVTQGVGCPISRAINPTLKELQKAYAPKGVEFLLLNSNLHETTQSVVEEAREFAFTIPVLMDSDQKVGEHLGVTRTATVHVIDPRTWKIVYRGPVDDRVTYERQRQEAREHWAKDALDVLLTGQGRIAQADRPAEGCLINFEAREARTAAAH